jgi:hypothetical protein
MATIYSPNVVTNGLQLCLDARNTRSYPGSGTSWYDLSGNGRTFTWNTTPSWDSSGFFSTSGKVATGPASNAININNATGYTIFTVFQTNTATTNALFKVYGSGGANRAIFCHPSWTVGTIYFDQGGCCADSQRLTTSLPAYGTWTFMALTSSVTSRKIYINGGLAASTSTLAADINVTSTAMQINPSDEGYNWDGKLAYFSIYNREISVTEYLQNYSALRDRFGI